MSVHFGRWNWEGHPPDSDYIDKVSTALAPYGPDSNESYARGGLKILYRAFHTTEESRRETQPHLSSSGAVITWDGRLDNRDELINELRDSLTIASTDVVIVSAAFEKWGADCFGKLIGDWALSICKPTNRSLLLAKDPIGMRHLYYSIDKDHVTWSTILDPLVLFSGKTFAICEEYIAGWFSHFPSAHLTPYVGISAVPPSSYVLLGPGRHLGSQYWDFDPGKRIRYRRDAEYEEHFRTVFATAVQRRVRSDRPVLAELSGGMDSSSIVCMADLVIASGQTECPRLDTITWYDESKPNWGELPHFTKVEEKRGRVGHHIDFSTAKEDDSQRPFGTEFASDHFAATPIPNSRLSALFKQNAAYITSQGYRITLSGIGGGEATGDGVPTPTPEFQNLLARARLFTLAHQLKAWATKMRKPRLPLLWEAVRGFFAAIPIYDVPKGEHLAPWLHPGFVRRNRAALRNYVSRVRLFGPLPNFQNHIDKLHGNQRFLAYCRLNSELLREVRYPYFDRSLLEFTYAVPQEQIVRVGQRRSLMKRALVGIIPDELLGRRKTVSLQRITQKDASTEWPDLAEMGRCMFGSSLGIIDPDRFSEALQKAQRNEEVPIGSLMSTLTLESWLRHLALHGVMKDSQSPKQREQISCLLRRRNSKRRRSDQEFN